MESIGERLQKLMESKGLSAYALSRETGISTAALSRVLKQGAKPHIKNSKLLADFFKVSLSYFLTGEDHSQEDEDLDEFNDLQVIDFVAKNFDELMKYPRFAQIIENVELKAQLKLLQKDLNKKD